jgi:NhaP-type Na+/H+ or K+/H+ antiporter
VRLWGFVIAFAVVGTILVTIFTHILSAITQAIKTGKDERDKLITHLGDILSVTSIRTIPH